MYSQKGNLVGIGSEASEMKCTSLHRHNIERFRVFIVAWVRYLFFRDMTLLLWDFSTPEEQTMTFPPECRNHLTTQ